MKKASVLGRVAGKKSFQKVLSTSGVTMFSTDARNAYCQTWKYYDIFYLFGAQMYNPPQK
jgi:hypothetical protein